MLDRVAFKRYLHYILPSMLAFVLSGFYSIIDGLFVGRTVGDAGLAGVNVAWPLVAFVLAAGTGIGMGGAVIGSVKAGEGDSRESNRVIGHTLTLLAAVTPAIMVFLLLFGQPLLYVIGGRGDVLEQAHSYLSVIAWGSAFQVMASGCIPLIRNKGKVVFALLVLMAGGALNAVLDCVTVVFLGWGVAGAALATVVSQALVFAAGIWFFTRRENRLARTDFGLDRALMVRTLGIGIAPFALTLLPEVTTVVINVASEANGGASAQAAFAVISYVAVAVQWVIQGVNDGSQPLVSERYGAGDARSVRALRRTNYLFAVSIGLAGTVALCLFRVQLAALFGISEEASAIFYRGVVLFSLVFGFYGITHATTSFFYAVESARSAIAIIAGEAVLMVAFSIVLPRFLGLDGVWLTVVATQMVLAVLGIGLLRKGAPSLRQRTMEQSLRRADRDAASTREDILPEAPACTVLP
jgi:Na+-driven multidrug efflux pump